MLCKVPQSKMARCHSYLVLIFGVLCLVDSATRHGYSGGCNTCGGGGNGAYNAGRNIGSAVSGAIHNKIQGVAGFVDGLLQGPVQSGCGGCSSSCGSPSCGAGYVSQPNPCPSNSCYSGCGHHGCGGSTSCRTGSCGSSHGSGGSHGSSGATTVIVVQQQPSSSGSTVSVASNCRSYGSYSCSSSQSQYDPSAYPNCQCDFLFNKAGQGNCNEAGAKSHTSDRWCYIAEDVNGKWVEAQWACPDAVRSDVHSGRYKHSNVQFHFYKFESRYWSRVACDTPKHGHG